MQSVNPFSPIDLGSLVLVPTQARAVWAIYVWCRRTDELVDGPNASRITPEVSSPTCAVGFQVGTWLGRGAESSASPSSRGLCLPETASSGLDRVSRARRSGQPWGTRRRLQTSAWWRAASFLSLPLDSAYVALHPVSHTAVSFAVSGVEDRVATVDVIPTACATRQPQGRQVALEGLEWGL